MMHLLKNRGLIALADQAVFSGTNFVVTFMLAHQMVAPDFGIYASIILVLYLFISVSNAIVIQPFQVTRASVDRKREYIGFNFALTILLVLALGAGTYLVFGIGVISPISGVSVISLISFGSSMLVYDFFRKAMLATDEPWKALAIDVVAAVVLLLLVLGKIHAHTFDLQAALVVSLYAYSLAVAFAVALVRPSAAPSKVWKTWFKEHYQQGKWLLLSTLTQWWSSNIFFVASAIFLGPVALGAFRLAQSIFGVLNLVFQSYENYVVPRASEIYRDSITDAQKYIRNIGIKGSVIFGGVLVALFIFAEPLLLMAGGPQYEAYGFVVRGMSVLYAIILIGYPIRVAIRMLIMNKVYLLGYIISLILSLCTVNFLLSQFELWGAIIGLMVNQLAVLFLWQYFLVKKKFILWK